MSAVTNIWLLYDTPFASGHDWEIFIEAPSGGSAELSFNNGVSWVTASTYTTLGSRNGFMYRPPCWASNCTPPVSNGGVIRARKVGETSYLASTVGMIEEVVGGDGYTYAYAAYCTGSNITVNISSQFAQASGLNYQLSQSETQRIRLSIDGTPVAVLSQWVDSCYSGSCHWSQVFDSVTFATASFPLTLAFSDITGEAPSWSDDIVVGDIANPCSVAQNITATAVNDTGFTGTIGVAQLVNVTLNDTPCSAGTTSYVVQGSPINAVVSLNPATGIATVTPFASAWGFQYAIYCNNIKISNTATVSGTAVAVSTATATDDTFSTTVGVPINYNASSNDTPCSSGVTTYSIIKGALNGVATMNSSGSGVYTPSIDFIGIDSITYGISCGGVLKSTARVTFNVSSDDECNGENRCPEWEETGYEPCMDGLQYKQYRNVNPCAEIEDEFKLEITGKCGCGSQGNYPPITNSDCGCS